MHIHTAHNAMLTYFGNFLASISKKCLHVFTLTSSSPPKLLSPPWVVGPLYSMSVYVRLYMSVYVSVYVFDQICCH